MPEIESGDPFRLGYGLQEEGRWAEAIEAFSMVGQDDDTMFYQAKACIAYCLFADDRFSEAVAACKAFVDTFPLKELSDAGVLWLSFAEENPLLVMAASLRELGDLDGAARAYREFQAGYPVEFKKMHDNHDFDNNISALDKLISACTACGEADECVGPGNPGANESRNRP